MAGLLSFGNYPQLPQRPHGVHWRGAVAARLAGLQDEFGSSLAFGAGRSYGDSCLAASGEVVHTVGLDRFMRVDWGRGVLVAEAGVSFADILAVVVPRGWFLPVSPGTKFVTLGGAIANDVHGKNHHHRGTFGRFVRRFGLVRSDREGEVVCAPDVEAALFAASIGGLGLTGVITWAEIQLVRIGSSRICKRSLRFGDLDEFFAIAREVDAQHEFCVSWVDCLARGRQLGRGVYMAADFAAEGALAVEGRGGLGVPFMPPFSLVNRWSVRAFNGLYWRRAAASWRQEGVGINRFFYPLDAVGRWNRIYGRRGFQQYQCVIPEAVAEDGVAALLGAISRLGMGSFLVVLKRFGDLPSPGLLSFPQPGMTLALDFPQSRRLGAELFPALDAIVRAAGGRLYPAKDAHMSGADFRAGYPAWAQLEALRDPALLSHFWRRVVA